MNDSKKIDSSSMGVPLWLSLSFERDQMLYFLSLCQKGFIVPVQIGCSLKALLQEQFGISPAYLEERIKTIFLNGKSVDAPDTAIIRNDSTLALSAALPGLAGATLRRGGYLASFRTQLTHRENEGTLSPESGIIRVKLFNLLVNELGPLFLKRGIFFRRHDFAEFWKSLPGKFWEGCRAAKVNGQEVGMEELQSMQWLDGHDWIGLQVEWPGLSNVSD
jgi:hypothetical protein